MSHSTKGNDFESTDDEIIPPETRRHLQKCRETLPERLSSERVVFGFDGFIDRGRELIDKHTENSFETIGGLRTLGEQIIASADIDSSHTLEWVQTYTRTGGHTVHVGRAFDTLGFDVTVIGTYGNPVKAEFEQEFDNGTIISFAEPGITDAVEFSDHKLLITDSGPHLELDWSVICDRVGMERLVENIDGKAMLGIGYWALIPALPSILKTIRTDLWPRLENPPKFLLFDPADIRQLPLGSLRQGSTVLDDLDDVVPVTMCSDRAETHRLGELFVDNVDDYSFRDLVEIVREGLGVTEYVGHVRDHSVLATEDGVWKVHSPQTTDPVITTSAGDHFAAGIALAKLNGLENGAKLIVASAVAGCFVRSGSPPTYEEIRAFVTEYETYFN